jgi:hypothetical protein
MFAILEEMSWDVGKKNIDHTTKFTYKYNKEDKKI